MKPSVVLCVVVVAFFLASSAHSARQCGKQPQDQRIVGGEPAPEGDWPWQALLAINFGPGQTGLCGGTLVDQHWVVTAAHCTYGRQASDVTVRLGVHDVDGNVGTEQNRTVEEIFNHPSYSSNSLSSDISMLKLSEPADINRAVNLACLPESKGRVRSGKKCWVTGYGTLKYGGKTADVLMQVKVPVVSGKRCKKAFPGNIDQTMICAGLKRGGKDACQGDSGGPLMCKKKGRYFLEGVVSWGEGCAKKNKYGVYAKVRFFKKWIKVTMSAN
ncbi:hypothetical protein ACROYT_G019611 [Oculina patagonica]